MHFMVKSNSFICFFSSRSVFGKMILCLKYFTLFVLPHKTTSHISSTMYTQSPYSPPTVIVRVRVSIRTVE